MHAELKSLDADAIASLELGVIWASVYLSSQLIRNAQKDESYRLSSSPFYGLITWTRGDKEHRFRHCQPSSRRVLGRAVSYPNPPPELTQRSSEAGILLESKTESAKAESEINTRMEHRLILPLHPRAPNSPSPVQAAYGYHSVVAAIVYAPAGIWPRRRYC